MIKPRVGLTVFTSSPIIFLTIVVLPALSRPLQEHHVRVQRAIAIGLTHSIRIRNSLSLSRAFRRMDSISSTALGGHRTKKGLLNEKLYSQSKFKV